MADTPYGPARSMLESLKTFGDMWGFVTLEEAADVIDKMSARKAAKDAETAARTGASVLVPGPTRTQ